MVQANEAKQLTDARLEKNQEDFQNNFSLIESALDEAIYAAANAGQQEISLYDVIVKMEAKDYNSRNWPKENVVKKISDLATANGFKVMLNQHGFSTMSYIVW